MRLSNIIILCGVLFLNACGFEPMYGGTTRGSYGAAATEDVLSKIQIANIPDEEGQFLRNALIDRLYRNGRPANPSYILRVASIAETERNLDITIESEVTRRQIQMATTMVLIEADSGQEILSRSIKATNSYNVLGSQFTTIVSEEDAKEAVLNDLARQIQTQLTLYFKQ